MEHVDGCTLRQIIDFHFGGHNKMTLPYATRILYYVVQLLNALEVLHHHRIVHRDLKPDNLLIDMTGNLKVTDFGIIHLQDASITAEGAMVGTPRYMSPEQVEGTTVDDRSDIYAIGILLYESVVGLTPFREGDVSYQQVHAVPVPPRLISECVPDSLEEIILKCLAKSPPDRFATAFECKMALQRILVELGGCADRTLPEMTEPIKV